MVALPAGVARGRRRGDGDRRGAARDGGDAHAGARHGRGCHACVGGGHGVTRGASLLEGYGRPPAAVDDDAGGRRGDIGGCLGERPLDALRCGGAVAPRVVGRGRGRAGVVAGLGGAGRAGERVTRSGGHAHLRLAGVAHGVAARHGDAGAGDRPGERLGGGGAVGPGVALGQRRRAGVGAGVGRLVGAGERVVRARRHARLHAARVGEARTGGGHRDPAACDGEREVDDGSGVLALGGDAERVVANGGRGVREGGPVGVAVAVELVPAHNLDVALVPARLAAAVAVALGRERRDAGHLVASEHERLVVPEVVVRDVEGVLHLEVAEREPGELRGVLGLDLEGVAAVLRDAYRLIGFQLAACFVDLVDLLRVVGCGERLAVNGGPQRRGQLRGAGGEVLVVVVIRRDFSFRLIQVNNMQSDREF